MIDERIRAVLDFVKFGRVADIGADHGYLAIELARSGRAEKIIATEKNFGPCDALSKNISAAGFGGAIDVRLGDGLKILSAGEVDTICVAGMGGALIKKILDDAPEVVQGARQLILQPMNATEKIRAWLAEKSWTIADENLAEAGGIIYEIISAEKFPDSPPKIFKRESSPLLKKFFRQRLEKLLRVRDEMSKSSAAASTEKFSELQTEIDRLKNFCR